jgi:ketosteroid isomerase-like protein
MADGGAEADMEALYRQYVEVFNTGDAEALSELLAFPAVGGGAAPPQVYRTAQDFQRMIEGTFRHFRANGWARSQVDSAQGAEMAGDTGVVRAVFSRYREDGERYEEGSGNYVMRRLDGQWRIVAMIVS